MTMFCWVGMGVFFVMLISGCIIKSITRRKVMGLDGMKGFLSRREEQKYGNVVVKFEE